MTLAEYNKSIEGVVNDLQTGAHATVMVQLAINALTMIKQRVQETGKDAQGNSYTGYSTRPMLVGKSSFIQLSAAQALLGSKKKRSQLEWRTLGRGESAKRLAILNGGYKDLRNRQGRQTDHVDFSYTGRMWSNINLKSSNSDHQNGVAIIGATTPADKKKLEGNTERKGEILNLSQSEIDKLKDMYNVEVLDIFHKNGL
jgi:hypothetical protein